MTRDIIKEAYVAQIFNRQREAVMNQIKFSHQKHAACLQRGLSEDKECNCQPSLDLLDISRNDGLGLGAICELTDNRTLEMISKTLDLSQIKRDGTEAEFKNCTRSPKPTSLIKQEQTSFIKTAQSLERESEEQTAAKQCQKEDDSQARQVDADLAAARFEWALRKQHIQAEASSISLASMDGIRLPAQKGEAR